MTGKKSPTVRHHGVLSRALLEQLGAFIKPTGKKGAPRRELRRNTGTKAGSKRRELEAIAYEVETIRLQLGGRQGDLAEAVRRVARARDQEHRTAQLRLTWKRELMARQRAQFDHEYGPLRRAFDPLRAARWIK